LFGLERRQDFIDFAVAHGRISADYTQAGDFNDLLFFFCRGLSHGLIQCNVK